MKSRILFAMIAAVAMQMSPGFAAVIPGQIDDFEDGTTQGWVVGLLGGSHPAPPTNIPDGGPLGAGDNYLQLTAVGGAGAGSRMTVINVSQWNGDYIGAHVNAISMDLRNLGPSDLHLRLFVADPMAGPPLDGAVSTLSVNLPFGGAWTSVLFPLDPGELTAVYGDVTLALKNARELRIINSSTATFPGEPVVALLGVDNIKALSFSVPETSSVLTIVFAAVGLMGFSLLSRNQVIQRSA
jgi:hypothetical protein